MMKRLFISGLLMVTLTSVSVEGAENGRGVYLGIGHAASFYNDGDYLKDEFQIDHLDGSDTGFVIYGGYQLDEILGIEASYTDYGKFNADQKVSQASTAYTLAVNLGYSFLDGQLRPFTLLGLGYINTDYKNYPDTVTIDGRDYRVVDPDTRHTAFHYGLGIQYEPDLLIGFGVRLAYEGSIYILSMEQATDSSETNYYGQNLGALYLSLQYKF